MATFDDDNDPANGSQDEDENEDEEMEDVNETNHEEDHDMDAGGDDEEDDEGDDDNDDDNEDEEDEDKNEPESPSQRASQHTTTRGSPGREGANPPVVHNSPSPRTSTVRSPGGTDRVSWIPLTRPLALTAQAYDIVPTMAAPQGTSINAITATPDMRYVFSGGTDGYVRMYNWVDTANGKVPLTVAQKHPFVDSVMKAGSLITYWENEESNYLKTPPSQSDEGKWTSPVYSLAVQHQALWLLSGLESGGINLQTCRHQAGTRVTTLKGHTSAVSVLVLSQDETSVLSGSWDKNIHDWDLNCGKVKRSFKSSGSQIGAIEVRPPSDLAIPEVTETQPGPRSDTFSSNSADKPMRNGSISHDLSRRQSGKGDVDDDATGSPEGSLFGEGDHGSLFGEDPAGVPGGGNTFGDDDDDLTKALENEMKGSEKGMVGDADTAMQNAGDGVSGLPAPNDIIPELAEAARQAAGQTEDGAAKSVETQANGIATNGLPHSDEPLTAPPTNEDQRSSVTELPAQSESTFLDAAIDGTLRIWDRRVQQPIAAIQPVNGTPPWATGACWSPDGNFFYVGRRNCTVDEYSIHHLGSKRSDANRNFKFQQGSGPVYAVRAMPNKKHLVCASQDILRIYDLAQAESRHKTVPFTIVPGHRGGVISAIHIDPTCRFMLSAAGNRGWEGGGTEVLLGYEIGVQDDKGIWHK
ncbi:hypothetical protein DOTSEDRAFT_70943 [Dothistroma septosporum NZE10]|uniref:Transcription factor spt8 beta-propeller domain-containing protein n=1 Tax=Dothistroma septosporum (strain NZE10 / CBS 128990) TaxID=675120 RepID=N1PQ69_DOTSN|nr:hypothetical protein DOTSEDRAFT_70943 [Dothistroma septosporum NZE10]